MSHTSPLTCEGVGVFQLVAPSGGYDWVERPGCPDCVRPPLVESTPATQAAAFAKLPGGGVVDEEPF